MRESTPVQPTPISPRFTRWNWPWVLAISSVLLAGAAVVLRVAERPDPEGQRQPELPPPPLTIALADLDLGRVEETDAYEHRLAMTNRGRRPVKILRFEKSC